jgi:hypothetical protein
VTMFTIKSLEASAAWQASGAWHGRWQQQIHHQHTLVCTWSSSRFQWVSESVKTLDCTLLPA